MYYLVHVLFLYNLRSSVTILLESNSSPLLFFYNSINLSVFDLKKLLIMARTRGGMLI